MSEKLPNQTIPETLPLTPETGNASADRISELGFSLWGHGTPSPDARSFFERGVYAKGYEDVMRVAYPISTTDSDQCKTIADIDHMNNWPLRRGDGPPNVVLLAIPDAAPDQGIIGQQVMEGVINPEDKHVDARLVMGFYEPQRGMVTLNPDFNLDENSHAEWLALVRERALLAPPSKFNIEGDDVGGAGPTSLPTPPLPPPGSVPEIW